MRRDETRRGEKNIKLTSPFFQNALGLVFLVRMLSSKQDSRNHTAGIG